MHYTSQFLLSALYTVVVETVLVVFTFSRTNPNLSRKKIVVAAIIANLATIPYVWYVFPVLMYQSPVAALWGSEIFAFLFEAILYAGFLDIRVRTALLVSLAANIISFVSGRFLPF